MTLSYLVCEDKVANWLHGGIGRHTALKMLYSAKNVWVQIPLEPQNSLEMICLECFMIEL